MKKSDKEKSTQKDEMKQECIKRMQLLKLDSKIINEFKDNDKVYVSKISNGTAEVLIDNDIMKIIKKFEEKQTIKIYHVVIFDSQMYMFAIHTHQEIWHKEKSDLKRGWVTVVSCDIPTEGVLEFISRDVGIDVENGKIKRLVICTTKSEK